MRRSVLALGGALVVLAACTVGGASAASRVAGCTTIKKLPKLGAHNMAKPNNTLSAKKTYDVTMQTNCGSFTIQLDQKQSPKTSASFVYLVQKGFFDETIFHRIVPGFVIQGGDPTGTGAGGPGYLTVDTPPKSAQYTHGVVAMAKTQTQAAGTSGSQFFVVTVPNAQLPPDYAIVGKVVKGLDVVDRIGKLGNAQQQPTQIVEILKATVTTA
jgi:cyclophilin family peptidyl-prolyl cis-trans isomerase